MANLFRRLLNPRAQYTDIPGMAASVAAAHGQAAAGEVPGGARNRIRWQDVFLNMPFMLGTFIIIALFLVAVLGPVWAPQNPYLSGQRILPHYDAEQGVFIRPPLDPSPEYPLGTNQWGTDILSLIMHGARNTLIACAFITMMRVLLGLALGAAAGWNEGSTSDRFIMGTIGLLTSLPILISSIILILALDIRRGLLVFIIALSVLGWTEIAQYIRSEFLVLRKQPYIEGAQATGLNGLEIAVRHVIPNILPQLLIISFLEMGAVLMLLGELGFVGIFIGGGSRFAVEDIGASQLFTVAEVPEWGAMIAEGFRWLRSKPFMVFYPATAFFIAVMGFNALGEGLRRLLEKGRINTAFLLRKRMLLVVAAVTLATVFIMNNTGAAPWFAQVAQSFDGQTVYEHVTTLTTMEGRGIGQAGGDAAAAYITEQFTAYGLEPGWRNNSYLFTTETRIVRPTTQPSLRLLDSAGQVVATYQHQLDFGYMIAGHGGSGEVMAPLTLIAFTGERPEWGDYAGLDLRGRIALVRTDNAPSDFAHEALIRGAVGVIWVAGNGRDDIRSQVQLPNPEGEYLSLPQLPIFRVRPSVSEAILAAGGWTWAEVVGGQADYTQMGTGWFTVNLESQVEMALQLGEPETVNVPHVLGYMMGNDADLAEELVVVFVSYDGLGMDPDGTVYPGANNNAAGVGLMLEVARLWQEQGLDGRRSTLFVAWGGGALDDSGAAAWLSDRFNFRHLRTQRMNSNVQPAIVVQLDYVGASGDNLLLVQPDINSQLRELVQNTSSEVGIPIVLAADTYEFDSDMLSRRIPYWLLFKWAGPYPAPTADTLATIDQEKLQSFGEMLVLTLTRIVRETRF